MYALPLNERLLADRTIISAELADPKTWKNMEKALYSELYGMLMELEKNKFKTKENIRSQVTLQFIAHDIA